MAIEHSYFMDPIYFDNDFMTYSQMIDRLRKDINDPTFYTFDTPVPHNEEEYQKLLKQTKDIYEKVKDRQKRDMSELHDLQKEIQSKFNSEE